MSSLRFLSLWLVAGVLNAALVSVPFLVVGRDRPLMGDPHWRLAMFMVFLWIGCDLSAAGEGVEHFRMPRYATDEAAWICQAIGGAVLFLLWVGFAELGSRAAAPLRPERMALGSTIFVVGIATRFAAIRSLGAHFTTRLVVLQQQPLITSGVYRLIRHPSYTGLLLMLVGLSTILESPGAMSVMLLLVMPMVLLRVGAEERAMESGFGAPYLEYQQQSKRLVPFVY